MKKTYYRYRDYFKFNTSSLYWLRYSEEDFWHNFNQRNEEFIDIDDEEDMANGNEWSDLQKFFNDSEHQNAESLQEKIRIEQQESNKFIVEQNRLDSVQKIFNSLSQAMVSKAIEGYKTEEIFYLSSTLNTENKILQTQEALNNPAIKIIVNPVFLWENCLATPNIYKKDQKTIIDFVPVAKSALKNQLKGYWQVNVAKNQGVDVQKYLVLILNKDKAKARKQKIDLVYADRTNTSKSTSDFVLTLDDNKTIFFDEFIFKDNGTMKKIWAKPIEDFVSTVNKIQNLNSLYTVSADDGSSVWDEPKKTKTNLIFNAFNPIFLNMNGKLLLNVKKHFFEEGEVNVENEKTNILLKNILEKKSSINEEAVLYTIEKLRSKEDLIVWYDFEGFSMPYPTLDYVNPYGQVVFQVSVIKTINNQIISSEDIVIDPQKLSIVQYLDFIAKIYDPNAKGYVVYNKSYENTRLKEILQMAYLASYNPDYPEIDQTFLEKLELMVNDLISDEKCIDLENVFNMYKKQISLHQLKGLSSIKKIEKIVTKSKLQLEHMITPYKELEVQNGMMAMNCAISRYTGVLGDNKWNDIVSELKKYCHNDVMAMIMVYDFVELLLKEGVDIIPKDLDIFC
ncbi:UU173 family protein [[Mycoplasma] gypis]|uniref:DUF2779 domain-containing protein n=1 Tax=[Mycoplasma] gypis TaxID=92404 RepID=A0ABZ2RNB3_9BACT|nr:DUF2779 domain-containing protein [[Mycoplasma] gypis]MBN0919058.1 DUF2779 domain-containing protein [[Mycoplasma] gypis]